MVGRPKDLVQERLAESALIWDESTHEWVTAYRKQYKRFQCISFIDENSFNAANETYTSKPFECIAYANALAKIKLVVSGSPTYIYFDLQFSDNGVDWHKYMRGPFGDWRYVAASGTLNECLDIPILDRYIRIYAVSAGCDADNYFKVSLRVSFNG